VSHYGVQFGDHRRLLRRLKGPIGHADRGAELRIPLVDTGEPTGQPDSARIVIRYVPGDTCVETKSLKFYLASYRNQPAFNEEIVNRILDDLVRIMQPQELIVRGEFAPRGGIQLTTEATYPEAAAPSP